jgi:hypothetical protein
VLKLKALGTVLDVCRRVDSELINSDSRKTSNKLIATVIADLDSPDPKVRAQAEGAGGIIATAYNTLKDEDKI